MKTDIYKDPAYRDLVAVMLSNAIELAETAGLSISVERVPLKPLAMGNVRHVFSVRQSLKAVRALQAEAEHRPKNPDPYWHCALPNDLKVHLFDRSLVKYEDPYPFAECDAAYKSRYSGIRPEMTLLQWRDLWVQGKTDLQIQRNMQIHCTQKTPKGLEEFMIETTPGLKTNQQKWVECDQAYNDWYHKVRAEIGLHDWRELWLNGKTPKQRLEAKKREFFIQYQSLREGSTVRVPGVGGL